jgi:lysine-N-methylase
MSLPIRHLPVVQNWDCRACGGCCHEYQVGVTDQERERILSQGWERDPVLAGKPLFVRGGHGWRKRYHLNQRPDGACIFLSSEGRCRIHERFGPEGKPLACRLYPFVLIPAGDHWQVGLRFACPSAIASKGRALREHQPELKRYAELLEQQSPAPLRQLPPPTLQSGQSVPWSELHRFVQAILAILSQRDHRTEWRVRAAAALVRLCRQARFDGVQGSRLDDFLDVVTSGLVSETPIQPEALLPPTRMGRLLFRQALALYVRKDRGPDHSVVTGRLGLLSAALRFAVGRGRVPRLHAWLPATEFARLEQPVGPLPREADEVLERYYVLKVGSLQFCGPGQFDLPFWEGLESLFLTLPVILWLRRALQELPPVEAISRAVSMTDLNFAYNPALGSMRQRVALRVLANRGDLERLIAWYSR